MSDTDTKPKKGFFKRIGDFFSSKQPLYILLGVLAMMFIISITRSGMQIKKLEKKIDATKEKTWEQADEILADHTERLLKIAVQPMGWVMKGELIMEDPYQIKQYLKEVSEDKHITYAYLTKPDGSIIHSSDSTISGNPFEALGKDMLMTNEAVVRENRDGTLSVISPVLDADKNRMGMIVLGYKP